MTRRVYRNPPIDEALCEFRFNFAEWDLTIPGRLHERLRDDYPGKVRQQNLLQANVTAAADTPPIFEMSQVLAKVQLPNADGTKLVAVGPNVLSVHLLRPYSQWEDFRPRIVSALQAFLEISGAPEIMRVGVRYINRIVIPEPQPELSRYFQCSPGTIQGIEASVGPFVSRTEYSYDSSTKLIATYATIESPPGSSSFLLDLDVIWEGDSPIASSEAMQRVDELRQRERVAFEAAITNALREVFDAP